jgi:hypothetical protein
MKRGIFLTVLLAVWANTALAASRGVTVAYRANEAAGAPVAGELALYRSSHALVIGIDDYTGGWPRLSKAVSDAEQVASALTELGFDVTLKRDLNGRELELAFEDFFIEKGEDPEARLFVWYAGHGHTVNGEGYLIPADGVTEANAREFKRKALSLRRFGEFVRLAEAKHIFSIFDSCFAGTIFNVARSAPPPAITRVTAMPVRQFLTSGDEGQKVSDDGVFARLFTEAIRGERRADLNSDGYVTAEELGGFLTNEISNFSNNAQVPRHGKLRDPNYNRGDFVFELASLSSAPATQTNTPPHPAPRVLTTRSGLKFEELEPGRGKRPGPNSEVLVHYEGWLTDGTVFDSSRQRGQPARFAVSGVIPGWIEGLQLMNEGGRARLTIPPELAYGSRGAGNAIPPDATLTFDVELIEVD